MRPSAVIISKTHGKTHCAKAQGALKQLTHLPLPGHGWDPLPASGSWGLRAGHPLAGGRFLDLKSRRKAVPTSASCVWGSWDLGVLPASWGRSLCTSKLLSTASHGKSPSVPLFLRGGLPTHSAFGGCKDPSISSASSYPKGQLCFMPLAWSFLDCYGLAQRILGAEGKCQLLVLPQPGMEIPDAYLLSRCRLQTRTHSKCSWLEVLRHGTAA